MRTPNRRPRPAPVAHIEATGTFRPHPKGFAFVDFAEPAAVPAACTNAPDPDGTIDSAFVPPPLARDLLDSDTVTVTADLDVDGRATISKIRLAHRPRRSLAGTIVAWGDGLALRPDPGLGTSDWRLTQSTPGPALSVGDCVVMTINRSTSRPGKGSGRRSGGRGPSWAPVKVSAGPFPAGSPEWIRALAVTRTLAAPTDTVPAPFTLDQVDVVAVLRADAAAAVAGRDVDGQRHRAPNSTASRTDRTGAVAFTVDDTSTRDLDDAIIATPGAGGVHVEVHIADVAAAVPAGSPVDAAAAARGTSVYLSQLNLPMLPRTLSEDQLSLLPGQVRDTVAVAFFVPTTGADAGSPTGVDVFRSRICSAARLSYDDVEAHLTGRSPLSGAVAVACSAAADAASALGVERGARDVLDGLFEDPELAVHVNASGAAASYVPDGAPVAQLLVERLMVAANEAVAGWLAAAGAPALYRTHAGLPADDDAMNAVAGSPVAAAGSAPSAGQVRDVLERLASTDVEQAATFARVTAAAMGRAGYATDPSHHFGLDSRPYCHFTSPIRRYADLVNHRAIAAVLDGTGPAYTTGELDELAVHLDVRCGAAARAESLERAMLWSLVLAGTLAGGGTVTEDATVTRIVAKGASVRIGRLGVNGFVPAEAFPGPFAVADDGLGATIGDHLLRVGAVLSVGLADVDGAGGRLLFAPAAA